MAMGECSVNSSLQGDSKVKFSAWLTSWRPPGADRLSLRGPKVNFRIWLRAVDDSTINIILCIIVINISAELFLETIVLELFSSEFGYYLIVCCSDYPINLRCNRTIFDVD